VKAKLVAALPTLVGLAGTGLVAYGAWLAYAPAGFIAAGVLLLAGVLLDARARAAPDAAAGE
jgi:hypothetical protein